MYRRICCPRILKLIETVTQYARKKINHWYCQLQQDGERYYYSTLLDLKWTDMRNTHKIALIRKNKPTLFVPKGIR